MAATAIGQPRNARRPNSTARMATATAASPQYAAHGISVENATRKCHQPARQPIGPSPSKTTAAIASSNANSGARRQVFPEPPAARSEAMVIVCHLIRCACTRRAILENAFSEPGSPRALRLDLRRGFGLADLPFRASAASGAPEGSAAGAVVMTVLSLPTSRPRPLWHSRPSGQGIATFLILVFCGGLVGYPIVRPEERRVGKEG